MNRNDIIITHGTDARKMAREVLAAAKIEDMIGSRDKSIGIKPNLVVARPANGGATTHPQLVAGVIEYLQDKGFEKITIMEGSWVGDRTAEAYSICGYYDVAKRYNVGIIDTQKESYSDHDCKGMTIGICDCAMEVDFMINMPVLKGHCQTEVTCALKNNKGIIPNKEKRHFHSMGLHKPIAHLNTVCRNDFILVDSICGDLDFEEGGNPVQMNRVMGFADPVLCDAYACQLMGYDISEVPYIGMAEKLGVGSTRVDQANIITVREAEGVTAGQQKPGGKVRQLAQKIREKDACSACYAALVYALERERYNLKNLPEICIGQGYQGQTGEVGIGRCTAGFKKSCPGCPPKAIDVVRFLEEL
ncbi:MAG: DUF362 domain-containing protein [Eubacteriales bacterium]|jgi:uncharacterized protein (DUF362 family)